MNPHHYPPSSGRYTVKNWHPRSHIFDAASVATVSAAKAIKEGDELRQKLQGRRILECTERTERRG